MHRKVGSLILSIFLMANLYGCVALLAGTAGGAGTAAWLSGKMSQEVNASFDRTIKAAKAGLESMNLPVTKETTEKNIAQIMSKYTDQSTIWIDVRRVTDSSSKIEVRVGARGDKEAASKILNQIVKYL